MSSDHPFSPVTNQPYQPNPLVLVDVAHPGLVASLRGDLRAAEVRLDAAKEDIARLGNDLQLAKEARAVAESNLAATRTALDEERGAAGRMASEVTALERRVQELELVHANTHSELELEKGINARVNDQVCWECVGKRTEG